MMIKCSRILFFILIFITIFMNFSCGGAEEPEVPEEINTELSQELKDIYVAYGVVDSFWFIWNQNIAGTPEGSVNFTATGSNGGTVSVSGTASVSGDINSFNLTIVMTNYSYSTTRYNLVFTGTLTCIGEFSAAADDTTKAVGYNSGSLSFKGTVDDTNTKTEIDETGTVGITETQSGLSGNICGRDFAF